MNDSEGIYKIFRVRNKLTGQIAFTNSWLVDLSKKFETSTAARKAMLDTKSTIAKFKTSGDDFNINEYEIVEYTVVEAYAVSEIISCDELHEFYERNLKEEKK